jgi:hypothetical protein
MSSTPDRKVLTPRGIRWSTGIAIAALAALAACGGKKSSSPAPNLNGAWIEQIGSDTVFALISPSGSYRTLLVAPNPDDTLAASNMNMYSIALQQNGTALSGTGAWFSSALPGASGTSNGSVTLTGTASSTSFTTTTTTRTGTGTDNFVPDPSNTTQAALSTLQGTYTTSVGYGSFAQSTDTGVIGTLALDALGNLTGTLGTGTIQGNVVGTLTPAASGQNLYTVQFTFVPLAGGTAPVTPVQYSGSAYYRIGATPSLVLISDNGATQISAVFSLSTAAAVSARENP